MASTYYDSSDKTVYDGDVAEAVDLNNVNVAVDTAFQLVEADIVGAGSDAEYWAGVAEQWAEEPEDSEINPGEYSALHYAAKAAASASAASTSASGASTSASNAATSESNASTSASNASSSASAASTSETNAASWEDKAEKWAEEAEDVEVETGKYSALHHKEKALDAQTAAEAAYDDFDDRYLGSKASDPTLDNDGDALLTGALYFNSTQNEMRVYSGSAWIAAYVDSNSYVGKDSATGAADIPTGTEAQRPSVPNQGDLRFNTETALYEGYTGSEWIEVGQGTPIGTIIMWPSNTAPEKYLICNGGQYAYDTYPVLGALMGGSPGGNFNVPNIENFVKASLGTNTLNTETESVGTHGHTADAVAAHSHTTVSDGSHTHTASEGGSHTHSGSSNSTGNHNHSQLGQSSGGWDINTGGSRTIADDVTTNTGSGGSHSHSITVNSGGAHTHSTDSQGAHTHTVNDGGGHTPTINDHSGTNQPACILLNFCIKAE